MVGCYDRRARRPLRWTPLMIESAPTLPSLEPDHGAPPPPPDAGEHTVQFYHRDEFLVSAVGRFAAQALANGSSLAIVATSPHRAAIADNLRRAGLDVIRLAAEGRYVALDAAATLDLLISDGRLSRERFDRNVAVPIRRLAASGRPVAAFGEMVALLTERGDSAGAVELEGLWNEFRREQPLALMCGYRIESFGSEQASHPFAHICGQHTRVLPAEDFSPDVSPDEMNRTIAGWQQKAAMLEAEIDRRTKIEAQLRRREAELTAFVETAMIGLHWVDANGIVLWANRTELEMLGYAPEEYIGQSITRFHADAADVMDILARLTRGETIRNREIRLRCKDGTIKTALLDSQGLWADGQFVHTQCFTRDLSALRATEHASRHLAAIVEGSDDAIVSKNLDGIITSWNQAAQRIFGYTAAEAVGQPVTLLIPTDRLDEEPKILAQLRRGQRVDHFETIRRTKDGRLLDISLTISPVRDATGRIVGASKIARDISERKRTEKALAEAQQKLARLNAELEQRVEEKTASLREAVAQMEEFSYTISHDLRAPLRGMQVYSEALLEDYGGALDGEARHCLGRIAENAQRLDRMVRDVLTFSRISRSELRMENVSLDRLVRELLPHYPALQPGHAEVEVAPLHAVRGHEPSVTQIVSNLLTNAVKFVAPGVKPHIRVWTEPTDRFVRLFIRDNGIGIPPERQSRLFRMFERAHPELAYEGTGVGLAIVRKAATRMGGDVGLISQGVGGSTFWVQLPAAESTP
jgi:PAS domain S-box-containing protein